MANEIYNYDQETGVYIGFSEADESPLEQDVFLIPANATTLAPPAILEGQVARFSNDQWIIETLPVAVPVAPYVPTLDDVKRLKIAEIELASEAAIAPITSAYPIAERDTWPIQEAEAVAWTADSLAPTPMLNAIASARSLPLADVVANVLVKAAAFKSLAGTTFGNRKSKIDQVNAATRVEDVNTITWI